MDLPGSLPVLNPRFQLDGFVHGLVEFAVNQSVHAVFLGETFQLALLVLRDAPPQVTGHANIQNTVPFAGKHVNAGGLGGSIHS